MPATDDRTKPATLLDVAERAGVSRATASLVLRGTGRVSQPTRDRVLQAMTDLGYIYNRGAASLRTRDNNVIGVLVTTVTNPFFAEVIIGLEERLGELGYVCLIANTLNDTIRQDQLITFLQETSVAGVVMVPAFGTEPAAIDTLTARDRPLLFLTRRIGDTGNLYIGTDDVTGGRLATDHLIWHGCNTITYLGGREDAIARHDRIHGVRESAANHGYALDALSFIASPTNARGGLAAARELLQSGTPVDGIICHSDTVALGAYRAFHDAGLAGTVKVVSFDNVDNAELIEPPLTTLSSNPRQLGRTAAQQIYDELNDEEGADTTLVEPELIIRRSCGCPLPRPMANP